MPCTAAPPVPLTPEQQALVLANLGWVWDRVHKWLRKLGRAHDDHLRDDLFSAAVEGACRAAPEYDPTRTNPRTGKPFSFTTFITRPIKWSILRYLRRESRRGFHGDAADFAPAPVSLDELHRAGSPRHSGDCPLHEFVGREDDPSALAEQQDARDLLHALVARVRQGLPRHLRKVLDEVHLQGRDLADVGRESGLSRELVRQRAEQVLLLLRQAAGVVQDRTSDHTRHDWAQVALQALALLREKPRSLSRLCLDLGFQMHGYHRERLLMALGRSVRRDGRFLYAR